MFDINQELKKLPAKPGVYIMKDKQDNILYVGKAVSLKNRVRQYFTKTNKTTRIIKMVSQIDHFEYIVTDTEAEALLLECNLIKKHRPKFNVLLKDDKTYPYIKIDVKSDYPNVFITRKIVNDGSKYFGPYPNAGAAKEMVNFIKEKFKIRQCKNFKSKTRACLNYHIKKCFAPCMGYISKQDYKKQIDEIIMLLEGKTDKIIKSIDQEIKVASEKLEYEHAAYLRDKKLAIINVTEKQKMSNISENDIDVIGLAKNDLLTCVEIFFVRNSKMIGREHYFFEDLKDMSDNEILSGFVKQYYMDKEFIPNKIMLREELLDKELIQNWLSEKMNRKVELKNPARGEKLRFVEMCEKNAKITLENKFKEKYSVLNELKEKLNLSTLPRKIEMYDISNTSGTYIVAGMCCAIDGNIKKNLSKRFRIKSTLNQDDPKCMYEVISRRLKHSLQEKQDNFGTLPNIIFVDGGITQINAALKATNENNVDILILGVVKDKNHKTKALITKDKKEINISEQLLMFITNFQDQVHDLAISYHKKLRDSQITKSQLDDIQGIGEVKKQALLKKFGSVNKIKEASLSELEQIKGINKAIAQKIKQSLE